MRKAIIVVLSTLVASCANVDPFRHTESLVGRRVEIDGFMKFEHENRNLYSQRQWEESWVNEECIPLAIRKNNLQLIELANSLNNSYVTVVGKIIQILDRETTSNSFCREVGIEVFDIRRNEETGSENTH